MKKFSSYILTMAILLVAIVFSGMRPKFNKGVINFRFENYVDREELALDSVHYKNELGQDFTISNFKYYISNIHLHNKNGKDVFLDKYFLLRADDPSSLRISTGDIPSGNYTSVSFMVGVDSLHNCSGAQSGALDPANGMFWAWNTGYIFFKLEGKAAASSAPGNIFEYHIGGYKQPGNSIRIVTINFSTFPVVVSTGNPVFVSFAVDVAEVLKTPNTIDFSKLPSVTDPKNSAVIADNYKDMFSLLTISYAK